MEILPVEKTMLMTLSPRKYDSMFPPPFPSIERLIWKLHVYDIELSNKSS